MMKEELSAKERKRISKLGGQGRAKALTQQQRTAQARAAAYARYSKKRAVAAVSEVAV